MESKSKEVPILVAQDGPLNGQRWIIKNEAILGREHSCDIVITNRQVSRRHASVKHINQDVKLEDLGSKNGTYLNGKRVTESELLDDGDIIQIALAQNFSFVSSDATIPLDLEDIDKQSLISRRLRLNTQSRQVMIAGEEILPPLSVSQFKLLEILFEHQAQVVSRANIIEKVWGKEQAVIVSEQALDALIRRLRDRLAAIDPKHDYIATVRGHGLRLDNPPI